MPAILTANTFFYKPATSADNRRRNELQTQKLVADFFSELGFEVELSDCLVNARKDDLQVSFTYEESAKNIYKSLSIYKNGKRSNITAIKKLLK